MKKIAAAVVSLVAVLALGGCAANSSDPEVGATNSTLRSFTVALPGGKAVDCIGSHYTGNVINPTCDWANIRSVGSVSEEQTGTLRSYTVELEDGRKILCVASFYMGNVVDPDCNWSATSTQ